MPNVLQAMLKGEKVAIVLAVRLYEAKRPSNPWDGTAQVGELDALYKTISGCNPSFP